METLEEVMKKYKLSEEEHNRIGDEIKKIFLFDKYPVNKPKAIIDIAPPASGKTGLNAYGQQQFIENNVVIINSDEIKPFHPKIDEIAKLYPQYYTKITDQESNTWTSDLFELALKEGYNVIFEGTGRNAKILETIKNKMQQYDVTVRGMAVNELNCLMSILERYTYQVEKKGWGRLVTLEHFKETYEQMPNTIDLIEKSRVVKNVEVYKRGKLPSEPIKIYSSIDVEMGRFPNAKYAILGGRRENENEALEYYVKDFENKEDSKEEISIMLEYIKKIYSEIVKKNEVRDKQR